MLGKWYFSKTEQNKTKQENKTNQNKNPKTQKNQQTPKQQIKHTYIFSKEKIFTHVSVLSFSEVFIEISLDSERYWEEP